MGDFFLKELADYPGVNNLTVILMGLGVVFVGLIVLIAACYLMGALCKKFIKAEPVSAHAAVQATAPAAKDVIPNRAEFIAAVSAAIAEASGTDAAGIRIVSIEKK